MKTLQRKARKITQTPLQKEILELWHQTRLTHPSYSEIATKVGCSKATVYKIVKREISKKGIK